MHFLPLLGLGLAPQLGQLALEQQPLPATTSGQRPGTSVNWRTPLGDIAVQVVGTWPNEKAAVAIHGSNESLLAEWDDTAVAMTKYGFVVLLPDLFSAGVPINTINDTGFALILDAIMPPASVLLGKSWGGVQASRYAVDRIANVSSLVLDAPAISNDTEAIQAVASELYLPLLLLWCKDDQVVPYANAVTWQAEAPMATTFANETGGHYIVEEFVPIAASFAKETWMPIEALHHQKPTRARLARAGATEQRLVARPPSKVFYLGLEPAGARSFADFAWRSLNLTALHSRAYALQLLGFGQADCTPHRSVGGNFPDWRAYTTELNRGGALAKLLSADVSAWAAEPLAPNFRFVEDHVPHAKFVLWPRDADAWVSSLEASWCAPAMGSSTDGAPQNGTAALGAPPKDTVTGVAPLNRAAAGGAAAGGAAAGGAPLNGAAAGGAAAGGAARHTLLSFGYCAMCPLDDGRRTRVKAAYQNHMMAVRHHFAATPERSNRLLFLDFTDAGAGRALCEFAWDEPAGGARCAHLGAIPDGPANMSRAMDSEAEAIVDVAMRAKIIEEEAQAAHVARRSY